MIMTKDQSKIIVVNGSVTLCYGAGVLVGMMFGNEASELMSHVIDFSILGICPIPRSNKLFFTTKNKDPIRKIMKNVNIIIFLNIN